ncbi:hypothetical protein GJ744_002612 [Endocarpon pusillum]|uniref:Uncharacterized protein n=1 Tax=Endocarpon pusillum TaxID=364733 RepID=A0A8H7E131_9EURO|nr:hypothetical protein GJ744_002612 [Endocarpon pusillum]
MKNEDIFRNPRQTLAQIANDEKQHWPSPMGGSCHEHRAKQDLTSNLRAPDTVSFQSPISPHQPHHSAMTPVPVSSYESLSQSSSCESPRSQRGIGLSTRHPSRGMASTLA